MTTQVYVIREINGADYYNESRGFVPASDMATEYETRAEAEQSVEDNCGARDVKILVRDVE